MRRQVSDNEGKGSGVDIHPQVPAGAYFSAVSRLGLGELGLVLFGRLLVFGDVWTCAVFLRVV